MGTWHHGLQDVLMESVTKDSTEKIQPEVTNHLADINQHFYEYLILCEHTPNMVENENLGQVQVLLKPLQMELTKSMTSVPKEDTRLLMQCKGRSQAAIKKIRAIQKIVHGKNQKDIGQCCYGEFIRRIH
ncbi:uncharacterized protein LOC105253381 [Camponotus floridanus]|uniref:uncharacterized protein LOC105253381 n=1 Tax=Camponotus floridanus TaxID=104421 RepID=UPI000DC69F61|nr:uncharacterized protein LOC105253381 [Camponotus floridanus]